jgi:hypothetical protein
MGITKEFMDSVQNSEVRMIRIMLKDSLVVDPTFSEFEEMIKLAESKIENLYDQHDGTELDYNSSNYTKSHMDKQMTKVVMNFSKERIELLKSICKHLYKDRIRNIEQTKKTINQEPGFSQKQIGSSACIGGVAIVVVGVVVSKIVIVGLGVAVSLAGLGAIINGE